MNPRLFRLSPREVLVRGGQRVRQQADRIMTLIAPGWPDDAAFFGALDLRRPELGPVREVLLRHDYAQARGCLSDYLARRQSPHFYFSPEELPGLIQAIQERNPKAREDAHRRGQAALVGKLRLLGLPQVHLGIPIRWNRDPITGRDWPVCFWGDIDYLSNEVGDAKWIWELNRQHHWVDLARAFAFTQDEQFLSGFEAQLESWMEQNPPWKGVNWGSALEVAHRQIAWAWALHLFCASARLKPNVLANLLRGLLVGARYIQAYLSTYSSPNTHLIGEAAGLYLTGVLFPEFMEARRWREQGARILLEELSRQVRPDGGHVEQSAHYHRYALDYYLHVFLLAERNHVHFPESAYGMVGRMLDFMASLMYPDGSLPRLGDDDGGRVLFLGEEPVGNGTSSLAIGAALLNRGDWKARCDQLPEEACWPLGLEGIRRWEAIPPASSVSRSRAFKMAGIYLLAEEDGSRLIFRCGPQGWRRSGHGHADALAIEWSIGPKPVLVDPGTFTYNGSMSWRSYFRGTHSHNTVAIDQESQAEEIGTFAWRGPVEGRLAHRVSARRWELVEGYHEGYQRLEDPVLHRRAVLLLHDEYVVLCDLLIGDGQHLVEQRFQFAPGHAQLDSQRSGLCWEDGSGVQATLLLEDGKGLVTQLLEGSENPIGGWISPAYGVRLSAPMLCAQRQGECPLALATLLIPSGVRLPKRVERLPVGRAGIQIAETEATGLQITWEDATDYLAISHAGSGAHSIGPLDMDGQMAFVRIGPGGEVLRADLANGAALAWMGKPLCQADLRLESLTLDYQTRSVDVRAAGDTGLTIYQVTPSKAGGTGTLSLRVGGNDVRLSLREEEPCVESVESCH